MKDSDCNFNLHKTKIYVNVLAKAGYDLSGVLLLSSIGQYLVEVSC